MTNWQNLNAANYYKCKSSYDGAKLHSGVRICPKRSSGLGNAGKVKMRKEKQKHFYTVGGNVSELAALCGEP